MIQISELASCGVDEGYIRACLSAYQAGEVTIAVTGEFSSGKSCFLNALAGRPGLLPEGDTECTPVYVELSSGQADSLSVLSKDGGLLPGTFDAQTIGKYARYTRDYAGDALALRLCLKDFPLHSRIHIIDCPGTNTVIKEHEQITGQVLKKCDAVIYAANKTLTETDLQRIEAISRRNDRMLFLLTHMDDSAGTEDLPQEIVDKYLTEARTLLAERLGEDEDHVALFPIGSKRALEDPRLLAPIVEALNALAKALDEETLRQAVRKKLLMYLKGLAEEEQQRIELLSAAKAQDRAGLERRIAGASRKLEAMKRQAAPAGSAGGKEEAERYHRKLEQLTLQYTNRVSNKIKVAPTFDKDAVSRLAVQAVEGFGQDAENALRNCISAMGEKTFGAVSEELSALVEEAELPMGELLQLMPPSFSDQDLLECARAKELQRQISQYSKAIDDLEHEKDRDRENAAARAAALEQYRKEKADLRQKLCDLGGYTPQYLMIHSDGAEEAGAKMGRILGEAADFALLVWNPAGAAAKGAKAAGKGIMAADKVKDAAKTLQYAARYAAGLADSTSKKGRSSPSALEKIAVALDKVSLGGIGESIGRKMGELIAPSEDRQVEDETARRQYYEKRDLLEQQIRGLNQDIRREESEILILQDAEEKNRREASLLEKKQMLEQKLELQRQQDREQAKVRAVQTAKEQAIDEITQYFSRRREDYETAAGLLFQQAGELLAQEAGEARQRKIADAESLLTQLGAERETLFKEIRLREAVLGRLKEAQDSVDQWLAAPEAR